MGTKFDKIRYSIFIALKIVLMSLLLVVCPSVGTLTTRYYSKTCPNLLNLVEKQVETALTNEPRMAGSLLRLHFHDCFVNGCDGSVLLDDTSTITGEKTAKANINSLRGFDIVDTIKASVEKSCPKVVSCADILALAARESVARTGGPNWDVQLGRRDARTASKADANTFLPGPSMTVDQLNSVFAAVGLTSSEMVVLSGAHTLGKAQCGAFSSRLYDFQGTGKPDPTINSVFLATLQKKCPQNGDQTVVNDLDGSTNDFDINYYQNVRNQKGVLRSDQVLFNTTGTSQTLVNKYAKDQDGWFTDFRNAMIKMGNMKPLEGSNGEIRTSCRSVNS